MLNLIRKAIKEDIPFINNLGKKLHNNFESTFHLETEIDTDLGLVLVFVKNDKILGYLYAQVFSDNVDLLSICVDENIRYQHIGTDLIKYLQAMHCDKSITLEVSGKNIGALNLYEKCGFKCVGVRKNYYKDSDALIEKWVK